MIQGLSYSSKFWFKQVPVLSKEYQVITFDNRDVGKSDRVKKGYEINNMAKDAIALLNHLGLESAHVLGVSLGGLIAQKIAIEHARHVKKLVLIDTHSGGGYLEVTQELWNGVANAKEMSKEEAYRKGFEYATSKSFFEKNQDLIEKLVNLKIENPQSPEAYFRQFNTVPKFNVDDQLAQIESPTLIIHGEKDRVVPFQFAEKLEEGIPDAKLEIVKGAGHIGFLEESDHINRLILNFLQK